MKISVATFFFFFFAILFTFPYPPTLLCVFLLRNKELGEIRDCPKSSTLGRGGEVELGRLKKKKTPKTYKTRQSIQGSVELFFSLPFNSVVGFLLSLC